MKAKLIRDKWARIPKPGTNVVYVTPDGPEHRMALAAKLHEEAAEVGDAPWDVSEYADLLEVAVKLANLNGITLGDILQEQRRKRDERGGFDEGAIYYADKAGHAAAKRDFG